MRYILFVALVTLCCKLQAQPVPPKIEWQKCFGGSNPDVVQAIHQLPGGGYILVGTTASGDGDVIGNHGGSDMWVLRLDDAGNIIWQRTMGGTNNEMGQSIKVTDDGGFIVLGVTKSSDGDLKGAGTKEGHDVWVVKLDGNGDTQWQKVYGGDSTDIGSSVVQTSDKGFIMIGNSDGAVGAAANLGGADLWIVKTDQTGITEWSKTYGGAMHDVGRGVIETADGGYLAVGGMSSKKGQTVDIDGMVLKLDADGNKVWEKILGGNKSDDFSSVVPTYDGGYVVAGYTKSNDGDVINTINGLAVWVVKLDAGGKILWQITPIGSGGGISKISQLKDSGFIVSSGVGLDARVAKLSSYGTLVWEKEYGGSNKDYWMSIEETLDGGYIAGGASASNDGDVSRCDGYIENMWVVKFARDTNSFGPQPTGILGQGNANEIKVYSVYRDGTVHIMLPSTVQEFSYDVFDVTGRKVYTENKKKGLSEEIINLRDMAPGVYVLRIVADGRSSVYRVSNNP